MRIRSQLSQKSGDQNPKAILPLLLFGVLVLLMMISSASAVTRITDARIDTIAFNATNATLLTFGNATSLFGEGSRIYNLSIYNVTYQDFGYNHTVVARDYLNTTYGAFWFNQSSLAITLLNTTYGERWYNHTTIAVTTLNSTYNFLWYNHTVIARDYLNTTYGAFWYNFTTATVTLHNASWTVTFNQSYANLNTTAAIQALLNGTDIYSRYNVSYDAGLPFFYNFTTATATLHNATWSTTFNQSYANLNSSALLATMLNNSIHNNIFNLSGTDVIPYDLNRNISIGTSGSIVANATGTQRAYIHNNATGCWLIKGLTSSLEVC